MGARGIVFRHGQPGIYWFDMGFIATTAEEEFTPEFQRLDKPDAQLVTGVNLNELKMNGVYCGQQLTQSPDGGTDWWYVGVQNLSGNSSSCVNQFAIGVNSFAIYPVTASTEAGGPGTS